MPLTPLPLPILCCGPTPALQRALSFSDWNSDSDVVRTAQVDESVGGKATNAARAITCAGSQATVLGFAGGPVGDRMKSLLTDEGLDGVWVDTDTETRTCQTLVDENGHRIRELVEDAAAVTLREWAEFFAKVEQALPFHAGLLLCGSLPADTPSDVYATLCDLAHQAGKPVGMDAKGAELLAALNQSPDLIKINRSELRAATGKEDLTEGMKALAEQGVKHVFITDGPNPSHLRTGRKTFRFTLPEIQPVNPIGGGDTVTGVTFLHLLSGRSPRDAAVAGLGAGMAQTLTRRPAIFDPDQAEALAGHIRITKG